MTGEISSIDCQCQDRRAISVRSCQWLPLTIPVVQSLVYVPVLGAATRHLLHVALRYELLQLGYLPHPVEYSSASHVEYFSCSVLAVLLGKQSNL